MGLESAMKFVIEFLTVTSRRPRAEPAWGCISRRILQRAMEARSSCSTRRLAAGVHWRYDSHCAGLRWGCSVMANLASPTNDLVLLENDEFLRTALQKEFESKGFR